MANDEMRIPELTTAPDIDSSSLFETAVVDNNSATGFSSYKVTLSTIASKIVSVFQYATAITGTTAKTIAGAINELASKILDTNISSPTNGQVLKYNSTSGKWENAAESGGGGGGAAEDITYDNTDTNLPASDVQAAIDGILISVLGIEAYDPTRQYYVGDFCIAPFGAVAICKDKNGTTGAFDSSKWDQGGTILADYWFATLPIFFTTTIPINTSTITLTDPTGIYFQVGACVDVYCDDSDFVLISATIATQGQLVLTFEPTARATPIKIKSVAPMLEVAL